MSPAPVIVRPPRPHDAIAAVSMTLQRLLAERMAPAPHSVTPPVVTIGAPPETTDELESPQVNLFLYRVCENAALQSEPPRRRGQRGGFGKPPLALDLHFLLTAYGQSNTDSAGPQPAVRDEIIAHQLLGDAMRILHDYAILTPSIRDKRGGSILEAPLGASPERVKLTLQPLSLEDLSKVWTALSRPFRASAAYEATVVLIDSELRDRPVQHVGPRPLEGPHVHAVSGSTPIITSVHAAQRPSALVRAGETLVVEGDGLLGSQTQVDLGDLTGAGVVTSATDDRLTVVVPNDPRLGAGVHGLRVSHGVTVGTPPKRRAAFVSNTVAFGMVPRVDEVVVAPAGGPAGTLTITGNRLFAAGEECLTLVQGHAVDGSAYGGTPSPTKIVVPVPSAVDRSRPARIFVRVGGMQSIDVAVLP